MGKPEFEEWMSPLFGILTHKSKALHLIGQLHGTVGKILINNQHIITCLFLEGKFSNFVSQGCIFLFQNFSVRIYINNFFLDLVL